MFKSSLLALKSNNATLKYQNRPTLKQNIKTNDFSPSEMHLFKPAKPSRFPLKMEIRLRQEYTQLDITCTCLSLSGLALFFCLYLPIFDCFRCPPLKVCHIFVSLTHPVAFFFFFLCGLRAMSIPVRAEGSWSTLS